VPSTPRYILGGGDDDDDGVAAASGYLMDVVEMAAEGNVIAIDGDEALATDICHIS
jgi:hypothetical protein